MLANYIGGTRWQADKGTIYNRMFEPNINKLLMIAVAISHKCFTVRYLTKHK